MDANRGNQGGFDTIPTADARRCPAAVWAYGDAVRRDFPLACCAPPPRPASIRMPPSRSPSAADRVADRVMGHPDLSLDSKGASQPPALLHGLDPRPVRRDCLSTFVGGCLARPACDPLPPLAPDFGNTENPRDRVIVITLTTRGKNRLEAH